MDALFTSWVDATLTARVVGRDLSVILFDQSYVPDASSHTSRSDIAGNAIVAEQTLQNLRVEQGQAKADIVVFPNVGATTRPLGGLLIVDNTSNELVAVIQNVTGLSASASGQDMVLNWSAECGMFAI